MGGQVKITLKELRSLNQSLTAGKLHCLECNSSNVGYSTSDNSYTFDISSIDIRTQIISSIEGRIDAYREEVNNITIDINKYQEELKAILVEDSVSIESLLMYKSDLVDANEADSKLINIDNEIKRITSMLAVNNTSSKEIEEKKRKLYMTILAKMNEFYKDVDPHGNLTFSALFSKKLDRQHFVGQFL